MTEIIIPLTDRIEIDPDRQIKEAHLPVVPAEKISGVLRPAQIPLLPASKIGGALTLDQLPFGMVQTADLNSAIQLHKQEIDPHPQYAKDADLAAHASDQELHLHEGAIGNAEVATDAAIDWGKISKSGAVAADVGAAASAHTHTSLVVESATAPLNPVLRQRWRDTTDNLVWWWDNQYWRSEQIFPVRTSVTAFSATVGNGFLPAPKKYNLYYLYLTVSATTVGTLDGTNNWSIDIRREGDTTVAWVSEASIVFNAGVANDNLNTSIDLNLHRDVAATGMRHLRVAAVRAGAAPNLNNPSVELFYQLVKR